MQYERFADGKMIPLPKPSVDTGMGLERLASIIQNVESNYLTDGMQNILQGFAKALKKPYGKNSDDDLALRVLTDHIRAVSFLIADGVQPSNEGRGYVLRRILRRAIRYGKKLDCSEPFFYQGVNFVDAEMGKAYPEIRQNLEAIKKMIYHEEEKFFETLDNGLKLLDRATSTLKVGDLLNGQIAFQLYDTFGFPLDLTEVILRERQLGLDQAGFDKELELQRDRSRASWKGSGESAVASLYKDLANQGIRSEFTGYKSLEENTKILALIHEGKVVENISEGMEGEIILERIPFYAESGGQVGDQGVIVAAAAEFEVQDTLKPVSQFFITKGRVKKGIFKKSDKVTAKVNIERRMKTRINHTITHVLHATLQEVLGAHIKQAGSLVHPDYLRFDFTHFSSLEREELRKIESIVNTRIRANASVRIEELALDEAIASGAKAFFDEKYGDKVRVLSVGDFSKELCGGTHAESLGEAGLFKITSETSVASGVRRIVAITGEKAYQYVLEQESLLETLGDILKSPEKELVTKVEKLLKEKQDLQKKLSQQQLAPKKDIQELLREIAGVKTLIEICKIEDVKDLRTLSDQYKQKLKSGLIILGAAVEGKATVIFALTDDLAPLFQLNKLVDKVSAILGGRGGGRPNFAQVGGPNIQALSESNLVALTQAHLEGLKLTA